MGGPFSHLPDPFMADPITTVLAIRAGIDEFGEPTDPWATVELGGLEVARLAAEEMSPADAPLPPQAEAKSDAKNYVEPGSEDYEEISFGDVIEEETDGTESGSDGPGEAGHH